MGMASNLTFSKWEGLGNDFVLVVADQVFTEAESLAIEICDRHFGVGADGLIFVLPGHAASVFSCRHLPDGHIGDKAVTEQSCADLVMEIYNADGTVAEMCGNGIRCAAALARREHLVDAEQFTVLSRSGPKHITVESTSPWSIRVDMGQAQVLLLKGEQVSTCTLSDGRICPAVLVNVGNYHLVVFVPDLESVDVAREGARLEHICEQGANVEFVVPSSEHALTVNVFERGVGPTLACGTGACASFVASLLRGLVNDHATVRLPGGSLQISGSATGTIYMTGPVRQLYRGVWNPDKR